MQITDSIISKDHVHGHLISTPQEVKFCTTNARKNTYTEVAWYEETTSVIFRKKVFSVKKYGVMQAYKLAVNFREMLESTKAYRMECFIARVKEEMKQEMIALQVRK